MALDQAPHHVGLARRAECRADLLGLLHLDQAVDDVAALHQQAMHAFIDRVDLLAQLGERRRGGRLGHAGNLKSRTASSRCAKRVSKDEATFWPHGSR